MEERRIQLHPYLDAEIIDAVYRAVGAKAGGAGGGARKTANTAKGKGFTELLIANTTSGISVTITITTTATITTTIKVYHYHYYRYYYH